MSIFSSIVFLATVIFEYQLTFPWSTAPPERNSPGSGYIAFLEPMGSGGLEGVYDFSFTSLPSSPQADRPLVSEVTFGLQDVTSLGPIAWNESKITGFSFLLERENADVHCLVDAGTVQIFYPLDYIFNESAAYGISWKFSGARNVPEAGGTLAYLAMGLIALIWRKK